MVSGCKTLYLHHSGERGSRPNIPVRWPAYQPGHQGYHYQQKKRITGWEDATGTRLPGGTYYSYNDDAAGIRGKEDSTGGRWR